MRRVWGWFVAVGGLAMAVVGVGFVGELADRHLIEDPVRGNLIVVGVATLLVPAVLGVLMWRRTHRPAGPMLALAAGAAALSTWRYSIHPWPATLGMAVFLVTPLLAMHVAFAAPDGVQSPVVRRRLWVVHGAVAGVGLAVLLMASTGLAGWTVVTLTEGPENWMNRPAGVVLEAPGTARFLYAMWWVLVGGIAVAGLVVRWRMVQAAPAVARRLQRPVALALGLWTAALIAAGVGTWTRHAGGNELSDGLSLGLPFFAFGTLAVTVAWIDLVRPRLNRAADGVLELGPVGSDVLESQLAELLGDPTVKVSFASGSPVITHDPADRPEAVALAMRLTSAVIEVEAATALAQARAEEARVATARLVAAGDTAARELSESLVRGPLARLSALAAGLRSDPASLDEAAATLVSINGDVRAISHGLR